MTICMLTTYLGIAYMLTTYLGIAYMLTTYLGIAYMCPWYRLYVPLLSAQVRLRRRSAASTILHRYIERPTRKLIPIC